MNAEKWMLREVSLSISYLYSFILFHFALFPHPLYFENLKIILAENFSENFFSQIELILNEMKAFEVFKSVPLLRHILWMFDAYL